MYGVYGLKHHTVEISGDVTDPDGQTNKRTTSKYSATQLLIYEALSFAIQCFDQISTAFQNDDIIIRYRLFVQ